MSAYPVHLDLAGRRVVVVGAGPVAARKVEGLLAVGARVTVVAPEVCPALDGRGDVELHRRVVELPDDVRGAWLVITATGDPAIDGAVAATCTEQRIWSNSADDPDRCAFTLPAVLRRGPVTVSVGTAGASPAFAGWLRDRCGEVVGDECATVAEMMSDARRRVRAAGHRTEGLAWRRQLDAGLVDLVASGRAEEARVIVDRFVDGVLAGKGEQ